MPAMITMKNTEIKRTMTKTYTLVLTEEQMDLIYDALTEYENGYDYPDECRIVISEMHEQFKDQ